MTIDIANAIQQRHCKRQFLDKAVNKDDIVNILNWAKQAASSKNTQPWEVVVLMNESRDALSQALCDKFDQKQTETLDYDYMMDPIPDQFMDRARDCGHKLFELKNIGRRDIPARRAHNRENFTFFNAPVHMIFHLPENSGRGNFLDMGLFMQNVMLGLLHFGLGSCPQVSIAMYPDTVRTVCNIPSSQWIVSGLSVGYPDEEALVNTYIPSREPLTSFATFLD
mgnify:CR=1 FL=1